MTDAAAEVCVDPRVRVLETTYRRWEGGVFHRHTSSAEQVPEDEPYIRRIPADHHRWLYVCGAPDGSDPAAQESAQPEVLARYLIEGGEPERWTLFHADGQDEVEPGHPLLYVRGADGEVDRGAGLPRWAYLSRVALTRELEAELCNALPDLADEVDDLALVEHPALGVCMTVTEPVSVGYTLSAMYRAAREKLVSFACLHGEMTPDEQQVTTERQGKYVIARALASLRESQDTWERIDDDLRVSDDGYDFEVFLRAYEADRDALLRHEAHRARDLSKWLLHAPWKFSERAHLRLGAAQGLRFVRHVGAVIDRLGESSFGRRQLAGLIEDPEGAMHAVLHHQQGWVSTVLPFTQDLMPAVASIFKGVLEAGARRPADVAVMLQRVGVNVAAETIHGYSVSVITDMGQLEADLAALNLVLVLLQLADGADLQEVIDVVGATLDVVAPTVELLDELARASPWVSALASVAGVVSSTMDVVDSLAVGDEDAALGHGLQAMGSALSVAGSLFVVAKGMAAAGAACPPAAVICFIAGGVLTVAGFFVALLGADQPIEIWAAHCCFGEDAGDGDALPWSEGPLETLAQDPERQLRVLYRIVTAFSVRGHAQHYRCIVGLGFSRPETVLHLDLDLAYDLPGARETRLSLRIVPRTAALEVLSADWSLEHGVFLRWRAPNGREYTSPQHPGAPNLITWGYTPRGCSTGFELSLQLANPPGYGGGGLAPVLVRAVATARLDLLGDGSLVLPGADGLEVTVLERLRFQETPVWSIEV